MMMRTVVVAGTLLLGVGAVVAQQDIAVQQDNLMRGQGKKSIWDDPENGERRNSVRSGGDRYRDRAA